MRSVQVIFLVTVVIVMYCCKSNSKESELAEKTPKSSSDTVIVDCNYTFEQALKGTKAPAHITNQLVLITVHYYSMDGKVHQGQILTNKKISNDLRDIFREILRLHFPVHQVIPVVKYKWDDQASMQANNSYSFCYRNIDYSKHAYGLAFDLNPMQNPNRWKEKYSYRKNQPAGAVYNPKAPGTLIENQPVVALFVEKGFKWGRTFTRNCDDHHFEKK